MEELKQKENDLNFVMQMDFLYKLLKKEDTVFVDTESGNPLIC